jgi:hypothetical protein
MKNGVFWNVAPCGSCKNQRNGGTCRLSLPEKNSVALVRERTIPTKRPPLVGEVSANFCG